MRAETLKVILFQTILIVGLTSCGEEVLYHDNIDFENGKWPAELSSGFELNIDDSASNYNLAYTIRNSIDYPYYNLYLKYSIKDSLGKVIDENLQEVILMDQKTGRPFGSGFGEMYDHQFISVRDFKLHHYMRHDSLPEIYSIGLKLIKSDGQTD